MSLSLRDFDQDPRDGWRLVARDPLCRETAADLIKRYREMHGPSSMLYWHEGQLRASLGERRRAIRLFKRSRGPAAKDDIGWNHYVDATIAFLKQDRPALLSARRRLAALPRPDGFNPINASGQATKIPWPPNLNVVDGLIECFGKPYDEAYGKCTKPLRIER